MKEDETWRLILGMPIIIGIVNILLFLIFFRQDTVAFSTAKGNETEAKTLLKKVYNSKGVQDFDQLINDKYEHIKNNLDT